MAEYLRLAWDDVMSAVSRAGSRAGCRSILVIFILRRNERFMRYEKGREGEYQPSFSAEPLAIFSPSALI